MLKENKSSQGKQENAINTSWQNVLDFGVETIKPKTKNKTLEIHKPTFVVLP